MAFCIRKKIILYSLSVYLYYIQIILTASIEKFTRSPHIPGNPDGDAGLTSRSYATTPGGNDEHVIKHIVIYEFLYPLFRVLTCLVQ